VPDRERTDMGFAYKTAFRLATVPLLLALAAPSSVAAPPTLEERNDLGLSALERRLVDAGLPLPTGHDVPLTQVETNWSHADDPPAIKNSPTIRYMPDGSLRDFQGKHIVDRSLLSNPPGSSSGHATNMGLNLYGDTGLAPGVSRIDCYFSNPWMFRAGLRTGHDGEPPLIERNRIQNHSWIGSVQVPNGEELRNYDPEILARCDLQLARDNVLAAVGITHAPDQPLLGRAMNVLSVGRSLGGALRPDIVAPAPSPSVATAWVSAAAALLIEATQQWKDSPETLAAAQRIEVLRAAILAGATKLEDEFSGGERVWRRTATEPLSPLFGAGELQIDHSHRILTSGPATPGATTVVPATGWDLHQLSPGERRRYYFDVERDDDDQDLSIVATWNRQIDPISLASTLANVDLKLYDADRNFVLLKTFGEGVDDRGISAATDDNIEHLFIADVPPGRYALEMTADSPVEVAVAWDVRPSLDVVPMASDATAMRATWLVLAGLLSVFVLWALYSLLRMRSANQVPTTRS